MVSLHTRACCLQYTHRPCRPPAASPSLILSSASRLLSRRLLLLVFMLLLASSCQWSHAALPWCGSPVDGSIPPSPTIDIPQTALPWLNNTQFSVAACTLSFEQFTAAHSDWVTCYHAPVINVHTCPRQCRRASAELLLHNATVYGNTTFSASSPICLAAIQMGVLQDDKGGAVLVDRLYPTTWSVTDNRAGNGSGSTLTPVASADSVTPSSSSHSSSVDRLPYQSLTAVSSRLEQRGGMNTGAADGVGSSDSGDSDPQLWTVRGRGVQVRQRQVAPFSPRSGHLHAWLYPQLQIRANWSTGQVRPHSNDVNLRATLNYSLHFIIGGRDGAHYMNDVSTKRCSLCKNSP